MPPVEDMGPPPFWGSKHCRGSPGMAVHSILPEGVVLYRGYNQYRTATPKTGIIFVIQAKPHNSKKNVTITLQVCNELLNWFRI
jgi:hypothetical protein